MTNSKVKEKDIKLENSMPVKGWFDHFRKRFGLKNVKITGEAASVDQEAAEEFLDAIKKKSSRRRDICVNRFFYADENSPILEKEIAIRIFVSNEEKCTSSFTSGRDKLT